MSTGELILYTGEDGSASIQLRAEDGTVWLTQMGMASLFDTSKQNISLHIKNIQAEGELFEEATVKETLTVQTEGKTRIHRSNLPYNLVMIQAVGYHRETVRLAAILEDIAALKQTERQLESKGREKKK